MLRLARHTAVDAGMAILGGLLMRWSFGLHPVWWLAWVAPAPLLAAALRSSTRAALGWTLLAGSIAASGKLHYLTLFQPVAPALFIVLLLALLWVPVVALARRAMVSSASPWAVLAYPLLWVAADTLLAHLHPDGNFDSLAYSQAGFAPALQVTSLFGVAGLLFLLSLLPAALAFVAVRGWRAGRWPLAASLLLVLGSFVFGYARLPSTSSPQGALVGMAAIDDFIGPRVPAAQVEGIWSQYEAHVAALAGQGARLVLLPEKIAVLSPTETAALSQRMAKLAAANRIWLSLGIGVHDGRKTNHQWLFAPDGRLAADYIKQHMAPPERDFAAGTRFEVQTIGGTRYGLAICKDVHFAGMGRAYAGLGAQALLVPAWDFGEDGEYAARLSAVRGVESGMPMVRASREGLLTISDAYGRVVAEKASAPLPGAMLLGRVPALAPAATLYSRTGDLFGWLCTAAALLFVLRYRRFGGHRVPTLRWPGHGAGA